MRESDKEFLSRMGKDVARRLVAEETASGMDNGVQAMTEKIRHRWRAKQTKLADSATLREAWEDIEVLLTVLSDTELAGSHLVAALLLVEDCAKHDPPACGCWRLEARSALDAAPSRWTPR